MGRQSKYSRTRLSNLAKRKPTIEDATEAEDEEYCPPSDCHSLLDEGCFFQDEGVDDSDSNFGDDEELEEDELKELKSEAELIRFSSYHQGTRTLARRGT